VSAGSKLPRRICCVCWSVDGVRFASQNVVGKSENRKKKKKKKKKNWLILFQVPAKTASLMDDLTSLFDPSKNHLNYQRALDSTPDDAPVVPNMSDFAFFSSMFFPAQFFEKGCDSQVVVHD
jgi:hypothetical protein